MFDGRLILWLHFELLVSEPVIYSIWLAEITFYPEA